MNYLEEIFSKHLINLIPEIHRAVCSDLIKDTSRNINQVPPLPYWLKCYRNSKSIFYISVLNMLSKADNASLFLGKAKGSGLLLTKVSTDSPSTFEQEFFSEFRYKKTNINSNYLFCHT